MKNILRIFINHLAVSTALLAATQVQAAELQVEVSHIKIFNKPVYVRVYQVSPAMADQKKWPEQAEYEMKHMPLHKSVILEFGPVEPGMYFIAVYQDLNNNNELDKTSKGVPKEPYALSNNPVLSKNPCLGKLMFEVNSEAKHVSIRLRGGKK